MKIACLQFAPQRERVDENINRMDKVLNEANIQNIDLLVLPEMAFTGNNFKSHQHINPYLEYTRSGITLAWARWTALEHKCVVVVGYPEKELLKCYNSAITVDADGDMIGNYRKLLLDDLDKTWASEGPDGFFVSKVPTLGNLAIGIGMDLNFETSLTAYEFAYHILINHANIAIISMAWISQDLNISRKPEEPDLDTLSHWVARLEPLIQAEGEIIIVIANRYGTEEEATYAGTSCVLSIRDGEVKVYGILGHEEQKLLVVDTSQPPKFKLVNKLNADTQEERTVSSPGRLHGFFTGERHLSEAERRQGSNSTTKSISSSPLAFGLEEQLRKTLQSAPATHWDIENDSPPDSASSGGNSLWEPSHSPLAETPQGVDLVALERSMIRRHSAEW